jgi:hypothetical protein
LRRKRLRDKHLRGPEPRNSSCRQPAVLIVADQPEDHRARIEDLVQSIVTEAEAKRARSRKEPLGPEAIRRQKAGTRPEKLKKSPAPYFHAFRKKVRGALYEGFALFVAEYREASEKLRAGERNVRFPLGCFPPGPPFVSQELAPA